MSRITSWDVQNRDRRLQLLEAAGMAQATSRCFDVNELANGLGCDAATVRIDLEELSAQGLVIDGLGEGLPPILRTAGRQVLTARGEVSPDVLSFLPDVIDDLNAREALLSAGTILADEFRAALLDGDPVDHARELVPPGFGMAVDEQLSLDLYAATVALMARLSDGAPAGCVAEEIIAVQLLDRAHAWLEMRCDAGELDVPAEQAASCALDELFELFEDDDVLALFAMAEPSDAAVAAHHPIIRQLGVVDQRVESWFDAFLWTPSTGYLRERTTG
jgi:hypothetical protein